MAEYHSSPYTIPTVLASSEATNYSASNVTKTAIQRSWRSNSTSGETLTMDLGATKSVSALWLQGINFDSATLEGTTDDPSGTPSWTSLGTLSTLKEDNGRWKSYMTGSWSYRAFRITPSTTSHSYFEIGVVYVFATNTSLPVNFQWGITVNRRKPRVARQLRNGQTRVADTGPKFSTVEGTFRLHSTSQSVSDLAEESGIIGLVVDTDYSWVWPMRFVDTEYSVSNPDPGIRDQQLRFEEVV